VKFLGEPARPIDEEVLRRILCAIGEPPSDIYQPSEDSFLMLEAISNFPLEEKETLDVGTGSGILGLYAATQGAVVTVSDIDDAAIHRVEKVAQSLRATIRTVVSDLFSKISGQFDVIMFNPPYLPSMTIDDATIDGGRKGRVLAEEFLRLLPCHLKKDGTAFLLLSSLNDPASLIRDHPEFSLVVARRRTLFFEELQVLQLAFRNSTSQ
jgi:release factor glutamine methyltransferase